MLLQHKTLQSKINTCPNPRMVFQEIITPQIQVPITDGVIKACAQIHILVKLPRMDGTYHRCDGVLVFEMNGITQILVI